MSQPDSTAEAQTPAPAVGEYQYKNYRVGITSWPDAKVKGLPHINLLANNRFIYGSGDSGYHGDYRVLPGGKVELGTCLGWKGEVTQQPNPELRFKMTDAKAGQGHEWNMERLGAPRPPSPEPQYDAGCKFAFATDRTTTASRVAVLAQTAGGRIIDGEIFLATKRDAPPRDASLWSCLVTNGYPGVEYGEAPVGPAPQPLLVLPDGRFRSRVRGGVNYRWWMLPAALLINLSVGQAYAFSVFNLPLSRAIGITESVQGDWKLTTLGWVFTLAYVFLGLSAGFGAAWLLASRSCNGRSGLRQLETTRDSKIGSRETSNWRAAASLRCSFGQPVLQSPAAIPLMVSRSARSQPRSPARLRRNSSTCRSDIGSR